MLRPASPLQSHAGHVLGCRLGRWGHARCIGLALCRGSVHYETEILLRLDDNLEVDAVSLGLDLTLRDLQGQLKKAGHPWEIAKARAHTHIPHTSMAQNM